MPKVLITGSPRLQSLEMSYRRAFTSLGWTVDMWDPAVATSRAVRGASLGRLFASFVRVEPWIRKANVELLQIMERIRPDMLLVIATDGLRVGTLAQARVLSPHTKFYAAYPDSPHSLDPDRIACLAACDRVGVSAPDWAPALRKLGSPNVAYLPFAADTLLYVPVDVSHRSNSAEWQVGFVGTWRPEREALLEAMGSFKTRVWGGSYWGKRTRPDGAVRRMWAGHELIGSDFIAACGSTAIMLNILDPITWPGPNMRSFELPACRAFALSSRSPAILEIFEEGRTIECFDSPDEARAKASFYLSKPEERQRIASAAHDFVISAGHTYIDRAKTLAGWLEEDQ